MYRYKLCFINVDACNKVTIKSYNLSYGVKKKKTCLEYQLQPTNIFSHDV